MTRRTHALALVLLALVALAVLWASTPPPASRSAPPRPREADSGAARPARARPSSAEGAPEAPVERQEADGEPQGDVTGEVRSLLGAPVARASVRSLTEQGRVLAETTTDAEGRFVLRDAERDAALVEAEAPGYERAREQPPASAHFLRIVLVPTARYLVFVADAHAGHPLRGAHLKLTTAPADAKQEITAVTGDDGTAWLLGPGLGGRLDVLRPGYAPEVVILPAVEPGQERRVDVELSPRAPLSVLLTDARGRPVPEPRFFEAVRHDWLRLLPIDARPAGASDPGAWILPRPTWLRVRAEGLADLFVDVSKRPRSSREPLRLTQPDGCEVRGRVLGGDEAAPRVVAVRDSRSGRTGWRKELGSDGTFPFKGLRRSHDYDLLVALGPHRTVVPFHTRDAPLTELDPVSPSAQPLAPLRGRVTTPASEPLAGARVLARVRRAALPDLVERAETDDEGRFELRLPIRSVPELRVSAEGRCTVGYTLHAPWPDPLVVVLEDGTTFRGRVVDELGAPVPFAQVRAVPRDPLPGRPASSGRTIPLPSEEASACDTVSGPDGRFRMRLCAPYASLWASKAGHVMTGTRAIAVTPGQDVQLRLAHLSGLRVLARRPDGLAPDRDWTIRYASLDERVAGASFHVRTLPPGRGSFTLALPAGRVAVSLSAPGSAPRSRVLRLEGGRTSEFVYVLEPALHVTLRVATADGSPTAGEGAELRALTDDPLAPPLFDGRVREDGTLEVDLAPGRYRLESARHGAAEFEVNEEGTIPVLLPGSTD